MKNLTNYRMAAIVAVLIMMISSVTVLGGDPPKWVGAFFLKDRVGLKWQPAAGATKYTVYRKAGSGEFEILTTTDKTSHNDSELTPGTVYTYKIAYTDASGEVMSTEKKVTVPAGAVGEFKAPSWSGLRIDRTKILGRWDKVPGAIVYNVYRSEVAGGPYEVIGNATSDRYADNAGLVKGQTYYYVVTALNEEFEETEYSEERSIKYGQSAEEMAAAEAAANAIVLDEVNLTFLWEATEAGKETMNQPADLFVNSAGDIYVTGGLHQRINVFDQNGAYKFSFGEETPYDEVDAPPPGSFSYPWSIFIDGKDQVWVSDILNHTIQAF